MTSGTTSPPPSTPTSTDSGSSRSPSTLSALPTYSTLRVTGGVGLPRGTDSTLLTTSAHGHIGDRDDTYFGSGSTSLTTGNDLRPSSFGWRRTSGPSRSTTKGRDGIRFVVSTHLWVFSYGYPPESIVRGHNDITERGENNR